MSVPFDQPHPTSLLVGVTGHRKLNASDLPRLHAQVEAFFRGLQVRYPQLPLVVLSSLAEGGDQLVAEVALGMGLRVIAPLPLPVALYRDDFVLPGARATLDRQLRAVEIVVMPPRDPANADAQSRPGPARDQQYADAGMFVSSHCHCLLALWDGRESAAVGGTAQVVRFHLQGEMAGNLVPPKATLATLGLDEATLVHHIAAARAGAEPLLQEPRWLTAADGIVASDELPITFDRMFRNQVGFNIDYVKHDQIRSAQTRADPPSPCHIHRLFLAADRLASQYQKRVSRVLGLTYVLAAATGSAFILYAHMHAQDAMIYLYLVLFIAGVGLATLTRRRDWHRKYLDYRALAEGLRVQSCWRRAGVVNLQNPTYSHDNFMQEQDVALGWIRNVMRAASLEGILLPADSGAAEVDAVVGEWIGTEASNGQLHYFAATAARRHLLHRRAETLAMVCLSVGIMISVLLAIVASQLDSDTKTVLVVIMGLLSVGAGVHEAYSYKKADKELIKQYRFMQRIFAGARRRLDACQGLEEKRRILRTLGEAALAEHAEWTLMHRERPLEHTRLGG